MLCECGCGQDAGVYAGVNKHGQPKRVINGHQLRLAATKNKVDTAERRLKEVNRTHCFRGHNLSEVGMMGVKKKTCCQCALEWVRKYKYGVSPEQVSEMLIKQHNKCAICGDVFTGTPHVDHDHTTQKIRGLLCYYCTIVTLYLVYLRTTL